jgi:hypothetical protein
MRYPRGGVVAALASALFLSACATAPSVEVPPGKLRVVHSLTFADGSQLKEKQNEVTLVTRDATTRAAAGAVALGILGLALGGLAIVPVDKDQFRGRTIDDASDRSNLRNTVATDFVSTMQAAIDARIAAEPAWQSRGFRQPVTIGGGWASLVYESLLGEAEPAYQLRLDLDVYKVPESGWPRAPVRIDCSARSEPAKSLGAWASDSYRPVRTQLDAFLASCQEKVLSELPRLLGK